MNLTSEIMEKAKQAKSADELLTLAKENGIEMTEEQAKAYYAQLHPASGEIADDELENVAGGGCAAMGIATSHENLVNVGAKVRLHWTEHLSNSYSSKCSQCKSNDIFILVEKGEPFWKFQCSECGTIHTFYASGIKKNCSFEFV